MIITQTPYRVSFAGGGTDLPAFYELHVWAWKANPRGAYADMNPSVSCEHAHAMPAK